MMRTLGLFAAGMLVTACASVPKSASQRSELESQADGTLQDMIAKDPKLTALLDQSAGYVVFPVVKQGGAIVGGAGGKGVVYEQGRPSGFAELSQASIGAQLGGQKYAELVIVRDAAMLENMKAGSFDVGGQASAVILKEGAATATQFGDRGVAVIVAPKGGAMFNVSLSGQRIKLTG
jgi:lipid-binding SYLF domain-containing protein